MGERKKKTRKLRFRGLIAIVLFLYLVGTILYYLVSLPIKHIEINGNNYLKDNYIISYLDLKDTSIIKLNKRKVKNKLMTLDLVSDVKIKKRLFNKLIIDLKEDRILFYNSNNKKVVLSSGKEVEYKEEYLGIPVLVNYVTDDIYKEFIKKLNTIDEEVLKLVSEIKYNPSIINGKVVDDKRFSLRMNDGNLVYINTVNIEKFNDYLEIYEAIENKNEGVKGCLYLDSNRDSNHFQKCDLSGKDGSDGQS